MNLNNKNEREVMAKKTEKPAEKNVKTAAKPAAKPTTKKEVKAEKPAPKAKAKVEAKPVAKPVAKPAAKPAAKAVSKTKPMTKAEIVTYMSEKLGITKKQTGDFLTEFVLLAYKEAKKDFVIPGIGKLTLAQRKKRTARNPKTGETIVVPAKKVVKFRVAKACKDAVLVTKK